MDVFLSFASGFGGLEAATAATCRDQWSSLDWMSSRGTTTSRLRTTALCLSSANMYLGHETCVLPCPVAEGQPHGTVHAGCPG